MNSKLLSIAVPFIWAAIVFLLHVMPVHLNEESGLRIPHADKVIHFGMFAVLSFLLMRSLTFHKKTNSTLVIIVKVLILSTLYGAAMEYLQSVSPTNRDADFLDWIADVVGTIGGILVARTSILPFFFRHQIRKTI